VRKYETIAILRPDAPEEFITSITKKIEKVVTSKPGELLKKDDWGVKRLAYEIKKQKQGRYLCWTYEQAPKAVAEVDKKLRFEENVLRFSTINVDENAALAKVAASQAKSKAKQTEPQGEEGKPRKRTQMGVAGGGGERLSKVDYKDAAMLSKFITDRGKIVPRRVSGIDTVSQRAIATAIKRARSVALLSYTEGFYVSSQEEVKE
jgi:small subunit ribosomal protein S6